MLYHGIPEKLHSDQGTNFCSKIIKEQTVLCLILVMSKSRTIPYHPMGNVNTERFNGTLLSMLRTLQNEQKADWKSHISALVHAYNSTVIAIMFTFLSYVRQRTEITCGYLVWNSQAIDENHCISKNITQ